MAQSEAWDINAETVLMYVEVCHCEPKHIAGDYEHKTLADIKRAAKDTSLARNVRYPGFKITEGTFFDEV